MAFPASGKNIPILLIFIKMILLVAIIFIFAAKQRIFCDNTNFLLIFINFYYFNRNELILESVTCIRRNEKACPLKSYEITHIAIFVVKIQTLFSSGGYEKGMCGNIVSRGR